MNILFLYSGSLLNARKTFPFVKVSIMFILIALFIFLLWYASKKIISYKKSDKFTDKEKNRQTKYKELVEYGKNNNLTKEDVSLLWEILTITKTPNIAYSFTSSKNVIDIFHKAYNQFKFDNISDEKLFSFFNLEYKLEVIMSKKNGLLSTKGIPANNLIFYLSETGEQSPYTLSKNTNDSFYLEIPEHIYNSPNKPQKYDRQKFIYKTNDGTIYNFVSRIIRYEENKESQKWYMIVAHTDKLESEAQRHFKREFYISDCLISPVQVLTENGKSKYSISEKTQTCQLSNISAGGCCIQTNVPIKENQVICIQLTGMGISEKIIGLIKQTRRLQTGDFALHIQFKKISLHSQNEILTRIYKYEL